MRHEMDHMLYKGDGIKREIRKSEKGTEKPVKMVCGP